MSKELQVAVLGMGRIGKRHCKIIDRLKHFNLAATIDPRGEKWEDVEHFTSLHDFLHSENSVDIVAICTPNGLHAPQAILCLKNGFHVLIEKPMALNTESAEEIITRASRHKKQVFCVMQNRYSPVACWLKEILESEALGEIYMVDVRCYWNRDERYYRLGENNHAWHGDATLDGGPLFTQFSHFVDMVYWLFGDWKEINSLRESYRNGEYTEFEDTGVVNFRLGKKTLGNFSYTTASYDKNLLNAVTIIAENGNIRIGGQYMQDLISCDIEDYEIPMEIRRRIERSSFNNHIRVYENVYEVLLENTSITTNAYEGKKVVNIIDRVYTQNPQ